jgi:small subunit ribosomal protein S19
MEVRKKEFKFRGMNLEDLKKLDVREFAKMIKSRQRRTALRNFQEIENFVKKALKKHEKGKKVRTHFRDLIIVPKLVGVTLQVYNGKEFVSFKVTEEMLGHKLGEFSPTRAKAKHTKSGVGATKGTLAKSKK